MHESYIESEDLTIIVNGEYADFIGKFVFRSAPYAPGYNPKGPGLILLPIWVPAHSDDPNSSIARFLAKFPTEMYAWIKPETRSLVDEVVGLTIKVEDKVLPYNRFSPWKYGSREIPRTWTRQDVLCVIFSEIFDSSSLKDGTKVVLTYRQPLIRTGEKRLLFYVPIFSNLTPEQIMKNRRNYCITVQCPSSEHLRATSELSYCAATSSNQLRILPENERAIEIEIEKADKSTLQTPVSVTPAAEAPLAPPSGAAGL